jgi:hypothetical protein
VEQERYEEISQGFGNIHYQLDVKISFTYRFAVRFRVMNLGKQFTG